MKTLVMGLVYGVLINAFNVGLWFYFTGNIPFAATIIGFACGAVGMALSIRFHGI